LRILNLSASNVFSLGEVQVPLHNRGLVLVTGYSADEGGANGAGKSSLANKAILWCLFGQTAGGLRADEVVNRHTAPPCFVEITFQGSDGKDYIVKRSRKPSSLELHCGTERLTQRNEKETQELINRALGRNYETFVYSDFFGQGRDDNFLSLNPKDQKAILERILPISQVSKWEVLSATFKATINLNIQAEEKSISFLEGGINRIKTNYEVQTRKISTWEAENQLKISSIKRNILNYEQCHKSILDTIDNLEVSLKELVIPSYDDVDIESVIARVKEYKANYDKAVTSHNQWNEEIRLHNRVIMEQPPNTCNLCGQKFPDAVYTSYEVNLCRSKDKLDTAKVNLNKAETAKEYWNNKHITAFAEYNKLLENSVHKHNIITKRANIQSSILKTKEQLGEDSRPVWKAELDRLNADLNPFVSSVRQLEQELSLEEDKLKAKQTSLSLLIQERDKLVFWQGAFGKDLKIFMLDRVCPFLTERVNKHLEGLGNSQLKVTFSTTKQLKSGEDRDEFTCEVSSNSGGKGYDSLSGGEQQIVSFAVGLALADLAESQAVGISKILILDEPFVSLDQRNAENLINYLTGISSRRETILLISNEESLKTLIPTNIHVEKNNGITTIK